MATIRSPGSGGPLAPASGGPASSSSLLGLRAPPPPTLRELQRRALLHMLDTTLSSSPSPSPAAVPGGSSGDAWKILLYDAATLPVLSSALSVRDLRGRGVTLHLDLASERRENVPDVPAVYFVRPTRENVARIAADCAACEGKGLYGRCHVNFVNRLQRTEMEAFASSLVQSNVLHKIAAVHDQYLDYVCLESRLFSLHKTKSYVLYNSPKATQESVEAAMEEIAQGLFSVVSTLGAVPIVRCPKGGAPEMVGKKVARMVAEHPHLGKRSGGGGAGSDAAGGGRPLLVLIDRNSDLVTPLHHTSTYQALVDDVLDHKGNRITVKEEDKATKKTYDMDPDGDPFYAAYKFSPFPDAIEANGKEMADVAAREQEVRSKASAAAPTPNVVVHAESTGTSDLASAVDSLPALLQRKKQLEMHLAFLQAAMNQAMARDIPVYFELENDMATGHYQSNAAGAKAEVLKLVSKAMGGGSVQDKLRLVAVFCLATSAAGSDIDEVVAAMQNAYEQAQAASKVAPPDAPIPGPTAVDMEAVRKGAGAVSYLRRLRSIQMLPTQALGQNALEKKPGDNTVFSSLMAKVQTQATGLLANATEKVSSMLGRGHTDYATRVVENLTEMRPNTEDESFLYLDPKMVRGLEVDVNTLRGFRPPVREVILFVIGGGCYAEFQNLQSSVMEGGSMGMTRRGITYGCTELMCPEAFLNQLTELA